MHSNMRERRFTGRAVVHHRWTNGVPLSAATIVLHVIVDAHATSFAGFCLQDAWECLARDRTKPSQFALTWPRA
jgi:hypothetical protein